MISKIRRISGVETTSSSWPALAGKPLLRRQDHAERHRVEERRVRRGRGRRDRRTRPRARRADRGERVPNAGRRLRRRLTTDTSPSCSTSTRKSSRVSSILALSVMHDVRTRAERQLKRHWPTLPPLPVRSAERRVRSPLSTGCSTDARSPAASRTKSPQRLKSDGRCGDDYRGCRWRPSGSSTSRSTTRRVTLVALTGELDLTNVDELDARLAALANGPPLVLDLESSRLRGQRRAPPVVPDRPRAGCGRRRLRDRADGARRHNARDRRARTRRAARRHA